MDGWFPRSRTDNPCKWSSDSTAVFGSLDTWNTERGSEVVFGGNIRFHNFTAADSAKAGIEFVEMSGDLNPSGPGKLTPHSQVIKTRKSKRSEEIHVTLIYFGIKYFV